MIRRLLARLFWLCSRWRLRTEPAPTRPTVLVGAPHTSNWDFVLMLAIAWRLGIHIRWLGKASLFAGWRGPVMRALGGIAVDRADAARVVANRLGSTTHVSVLDADGWYHTGDRVYRRADDPRLFYVGRTGDMIKTSGANVSPLEVEAVIESFDDVAQCVVVGLDHAERGEEVCAVLVSSADIVDVDSVARRTREALSAYKVPTRWIIVTSDQIPTLPSGKLNRKALREWVISREAGAR